MQTRDLNEAIKEAERFLDRAKNLMILKGSSTYIGCHPKEQGAVKRASMDLSRALSQLRNNKD